MQQLELEEHYDVIKDLGCGTYGKVVLAVCRETGTSVALKLLPKSNTKPKDFNREFYYSYYLSPHRAIVDTFDVSFETAEDYVFAQEYAPLGDLFESITPQIGLSEVVTKNVIRQLTSALEFMHSKELVHRDIKPENILVFDTYCSRIKLMDFGMTRKVGTMVKKTSGSIPYTPPEICEAVKNESYSVETSHDVWGAAVLMFCTLTGNFPWENAHRKDSYYAEFSLWQKRKTLKIPSQWKPFTPRLMRLFRKMLEPKPERRCSIREIHKYMDDTWLTRTKSRSSDDDMGQAMSPRAQGDDRSMEELSDMLETYGIDTKVSRRFRERRIHEWLLST
jgi:serine/threonine-protein kinase SBK